MQMTLDVMDQSGHTELSFTEDLVRVRFKRVNARERMMIENVHKVAMERGLTLHRPDKDGGKGKKLRALPSLMTENEGEYVYAGDLDKRVKLAEDLVESEVKRERIVMELQKNNQWKVLRKGEFKAKPKDKQKVTSKAPIGGG